MRTLDENNLLMESATDGVRAGEDQTRKREFNGFMSLISMQVPPAYVQVALPYEDAINP